MFDGVLVELQLLIRNMYNQFWFSIMDFYNMYICGVYNI